MTNRQFLDGFDLPDFLLYMTKAKTSHFTAFIPALFGCCIYSPGVPVYPLLVDFLHTREKLKRS